MAGASPEPTATAILTGQIVHIRRVSKKLHFFDLLVRTDIGESEQRRYTAVVKAWVCGEEELKRASRGEDKIHCGDKVTFTGTVEDAEITVTTFRHVKRWANISSGQQFKPIPSQEASKRGAEEGDSGGGVCKYWINTGKCPKGGDCKYEHPHQDSNDMRSAYVADRLEKRRLAQSESDGVHETDLASRHKRATIFADWLCKSFQEELREKAGDKHPVILDVAGGQRADVGNELCERLNEIESPVSVVTVDPRAHEDDGFPGRRNLPKWKDKKRKRNAGRRPKQIAKCFDSALMSELSSEREVRLLVGMHPDQATEEIVDAGLHHAVPFAIVPCCVFAHLRPERRLKSGAEPTTYEKFVDYLMEKNTDMKRDTLGFQGRHTVLHWRPGQREMHFASYSTQ